MRVIGEHGDGVRRWCRLFYNSDHA
jgi:hypothetical protein